MLFIIYNKNNYKVERVVTALKKEDITIKENESILYNENIKDYSQSDIRAYNKDGSIKSLEQQLKEKIITLEKNQIIKDNQVYTLNKNYPDDYIKLVELGLEELDKTQKIVTNENGNKYITQKTYEELFKENLITAEEYNNYIIRMRQGQYQSNLDGERAELLESVLNSWASQNLLTEEQKIQLESLTNKRQEIKEKYPKQN